MIKGNLLKLFLFILIIFYLSERAYKKTEYFKKTNNRFLNVLFIKGLYGEYLVWKELNNLNGRKKY